MTIEIKKSVDEVIIEIDGRLDTITAPSLEAAINEYIYNTKNLILDFKKLQYISSAGLRVLLGAQKKKQKDSTMKVKNVNSEIMEVFDMTGFTDILEIE